MSAAPMAIEALPELPVPEECFKTGDLPYGDAEYECAFSADQMHAYALAALAAEKETLRDTFAAAALAKIIDGNRTTEEIARLAYVLADAMLIARQA